MERRKSGGRRTSDGGGVRRVLGRVGRGLVALVLLGAIGGGIWWVVGMMSGDEEVAENVTEERTPQVEIVDENRGGATGVEISARVSEYLVRLTDDLLYEGYTIARVVLPLQKTREIDVYLEGRTEYYKLSIDRGSAVSAEDVGRMVRYIDEEGVAAEYVDLRVEGKAYYTSASL